MITLLRNGDIEAVRSVLNENLAYTLFLTLVLMTIQNTFTVIPLILLITVNIAIFGFVYGILWSWFSSIIAAIIVFLSVRYCFQDIILKKVSPKIKAKIDENGFMYVFIARTFPFAPTSIINIVAGASSIRFRPFLFATMLGNFIFFTLLGLIPLGIVTLEVDYYILITLSVFIALAYYIYKLQVKKRSKKIAN